MPTSTSEGDQQDHVKRILGAGPRVTKPRDQPNERRTKEHSRQIVDLVLILDPQCGALT
jgi:hypothetical protein